MLRAPNTDRHPVRAALRPAVGDAASRDGLRERHELLAAFARLAGSRRVGATASGSVGAPARGRRDRLAAGEPGQCLCTGQEGGGATGPNPTDRGKPGTKRHLVTDARGTPLGLRLTGANRHDSPQMAPNPRCHSAAEHGPARATAPAPRQAARRQGLRGQGASPGVPSAGDRPAHRPQGHREQREARSPPLGRGADPAWFNRFSRLPVRYGRRADIYEASSPASRQAS